MQGKGWLTLLGLSLLTGVAIPFFGFVAMTARMELVGDKPAEGVDLERVERLQSGVTAIVYLAQVFVFMFFVMKALRRN